MQRRITHLLAAWILFLGHINGAFSQYNAGINKVTIASPTAASLGKFGDIPVGYHTGIPSIDVPIYTVKSGTLELPIGLSYHAGGLKVQENASWVGAGWALNAGGVITRTVVGAADDRGLNHAFTDKGYFSDYGYNSYIFSPGPATCSAPPAVCAQGRAGMPSNVNAPQDSYIQTGIFDGEPDLYFFNFAGRSGKFYFNDDRTPVLVPEMDLKITPIYPGTSFYGMTGFIITTPDGVQYYFGQNPLADGNPDAIEVTYNTTTQNTYTGQGATSSWYLNRIVSADGQFSISLIYQAESYSYYTLSMWPLPNVRNPNMFAYNLEYDMGKNFINGVRLSKILFPNGEVDFTPGALRQDLSRGTTYTGFDESPNNDGNLGGRSLGSISVVTPTLCKKDTFYYGYFHDGSSLTGSLFTQTYPGMNIVSDQYRLRLDSIGETSCDATVRVPPYKFSYFSETVPRKLSFGIDHWGFANGVNSNTTLIPTYTLTTNNTVSSVIGANRDASWPAMRGGALNRITYPTGGYVNFDFEPNDIAESKQIQNYVRDGGYAIGWDGNNTPQSAPMTITSDQTFVEMRNTSVYDATATVKDASNTNVIQTIYIPSGTTDTTRITTLPPGNYNVTLAFTNATATHSGTGAQISWFYYTYSSQIVNVIVGGLRIKTLTRHDDMTANDVVTNYNYTYTNTAGGQSSGLLFSKPIYVQGLRNDVWATVNGAQCSVQGCFTCFNTNVSYFQSPCSVRPMATTQGNHIGYGDVFVSQTGNGYSEYRYYSTNGAIPHIYDPLPTDVCVRSIATVCDFSLPNAPAPPDPYDPMRGELQFEGHYNQSGVLLKTVVHIPLYKMDSLFTPGIIDKFFVTGYVSAASVTDNSTIDPLNNVPVNGQVPVGVSTFTEYNLQSAMKIRDSTVTTNYDPVSGSAMTEVNAVYYNSPYHHQATQTLTYSSKGEALVTNVMHALDYRISNFNVTDQLPTYYNNYNSDYSYLWTALGGVTLAPTDPYYYWQRLNIFTNYRYMKAIDRQTYINWRRSNFVDPGNLYTTDHNAAKAAADAELKPILELQDEYKNPVIESSQFKSGNLVHADFTHYDYVSNPANAVYPQKTRLINLQAISSSFTNSAVSGNTVTRDSRYSDEVSYNFMAGNMQRIVSHDGIVNSYIWDYLRSAPIAMITGGGIDSAAYTSFEADGSGNWSIGSTARDGSSAITGQVCYNLANGNISKAGLASGNSYTVSYWSRTGASFTVSGSTLVRQGKTISINGGSWTYFEHTVTGVATVTVSGSGGIDELRLYPASAQMKTYTYAPAVGVTSECDINNRVTYYNYDALGRLSLVKDQDGNVVKTIEYHYKGQ